MSQAPPVTGKAPRSRAPLRYSPSKHLLGSERSSPLCSQKRPVLRDLVVCVLKGITSHKTQTKNLWVLCVAYRNPECVHTSTVTPARKCECLCACLPDSCGLVTDTPFLRLPLGVRLIPGAHAAQGPVSFYLPRVCQL